MTRVSRNIRQLPPSSVARLINEVGLEDSHEILAAMDARQFRATMSIVLWTSPAPGRDDVLDISQFVRWLEIWCQQGDAMLGRRLTDLGEDFLVGCFRQLLSAIDRTGFGVPSEGRGLDIGNYVVFPRQQQYWPRLVEALVGLWGQEPDFVLRILRRCSHERSILNDTCDDLGPTFEGDRASDGAPARAATQDPLLQDLIADRATRRADAGHVSPMDAALFLSTTKSAQLCDLCALRDYDPNTVGYLAKADRLAEAKGLAGSANVAYADADMTEPLADTPLLTDERTSGTDASTAYTLAAAAFTAADSTFLKRAIAALAGKLPQFAAKRMRELAYLANVLESGAQSQGRQYTEARAVRAALATANLGATYLLRALEAPECRISRLSQMLEHDPGVVRPFQVGFHLLASIPLRCCEALYRAKDVQSRRRGHVVYMALEEILGASVLTDLVREGRYPEAKSLIDELSVVMDSAACVALRTLIDPVPAFPIVLGDSAGAGTRLYVDRGHRPIATIDDLERIGVFLARLADFCGN